MQFKNLTQIVYTQSFSTFKCKRNVYTHPRVGKNKCTIVHMERYKLINSIRINSMFHIIINIYIYIVIHTQHTHIYITHIYETPNLADFQIESYKSLHCFCIIYTQPFVNNIFFLEFHRTLATWFCSHRVRKSCFNCC